MTAWTRFLTLFTGHQRTMPDGPALIEEADAAAKQAEAPVERMDLQSYNYSWEILYSCESLAEIGRKATERRRVLLRELAAHESLVKLGSITDQLGRVFRGKLESHDREFRNTWPKPAKWRRFWIETEEEKDVFSQEYDRWRHRDEWLGNPLPFLRLLLKRCISPLDVNIVKSIGFLGVYDYESADALIGLLGRSPFGQAGKAAAEALMQMGPRAKDSAENLYNLVVKIDQQAQKLDAKGVDAKMAADSRAMMVRTLGSILESKLKDDDISRIFSYDEFIHNLEARGRLGNAGSIEPPFSADAKGEVIDSVISSAIPIGSDLDQIQGLANLGGIFASRIAEHLRPLINNYVITVPQQTLEEKKRLGRWITAELAQYGLAVECPNTPGLAVEVKGEVARSAGTSRFQFAPLEGGNGPKQRGVFRDVLPELNFVQLVNSVDLSPPARPAQGQRGR